MHFRSRGSDLLAEPALRRGLLGKVVEGVGENETCKKASQWSCPAAWRNADLPRTSLADAVYVGS